MGKDKPGPHIIWQAYGSTLKVADVVRYYHSLLGAAPKMLGDQRFQWEPSENTRALSYSVQPASDTGPWDACGLPNSDIRTVILVSLLISPENRD